MLPLFNISQYNTDVFKRAMTIMYKPQDAQEEEKKEITVMKTPQQLKCEEWAKTWLEDNDYN